MEYRKFKDTQYEPININMNIKISKRGKGKQLQISNKSTTMFRADSFSGIFYM